MKTCFSDHPTTRREFLRTSASGLGMLAFSGAGTAFLASSGQANVPAPGKDLPVLVLIRLAGGNDGLNTVVPFGDDNYYRLRPNIGLPAKSLHRIADGTGLHPSCAELAALFHEGRLCVIRNVGYPNPNRSHFRSMEIWETASRSDEYRTSGWIGRYLDKSCPGSPQDDPLGVSIGNEMPDTFRAPSNPNIFSLVPGTTPVTGQKVLNRPGVNQPMVEYPQSQLARSLRNVAGRIAAGQGTRVYFVSHEGFDTHANQLSRHQALLQELSQGMAAFQADLEALGLQDQVLTMTFSEFGRRPGENATGGTDHGTAAPLFVMGSRLARPLIGKAPSLDVRKNQDLANGTDFRAVYSTILEDWFGTDPRPIIGGEFEKLPLIRPAGSNAARA